MEIQTTEQPDHEHDYEHEAHDASQPGCAIAAIAKVTAPAAQQQEHDDDDQDCAHSTPVWKNSGYCLSGSFTPPTAFWILPSIVARPRTRLAMVNAARRQKVLALLASFALSERSDGGVHHDTSKFSHLKVHSSLVNVLLRNQV
jgi:hypothetical protein